MLTLNVSDVDEYAVVDSTGFCVGYIDKNTDGFHTFEAELIPFTSKDLQDIAGMLDVLNSGIQEALDEYNNGDVT